VLIKYFVTFKDNNKSNLPWWFSYWDGCCSYIS